MQIGDLITYPHMVNNIYRCAAVSNEGHVVTLVVSDLGYIPDIKYTVMLSHLTSSELPVVIHLSTLERLIWRIDENS